MACDVTTKKCESGDFADKFKFLKEKVKKCAQACCVSEGGTPCNGAFAVSANLVMTIFAILYSLNLF